MDSSAIRMIVATSLCVVAGTISAATEFFVDCNRPDDSGDGLSEATAKRTIQAAIDLTNPAGKDTVTVLPGVYREGKRRSPAYSDDDFRVVITNHCILRSRDGAAKTFIVGEFGSGANNQGEGAVRGVYMKGISYAVVEGFTITGCATRYAATSGDKQYGAAFVGNWNNYLLGCVISNNWSSAGAGIHLGNAIRCLIADNHAVDQAIGHNAYYFNCVITRNRGAANSLASYAKALVNCTCVDNPGTLLDDNSANVRNSVITLSSTVGKASATEIFDCVTDVPATQFKTVGGNSVCAASVYQHVAPAFGDWRLASDSKAKGIASLDEYKKVLDNGQKFKTSVDLGWNPDWVLEKYWLKDFAGNDMTGTLDAGAIQGAIEVAGGRITFPSGYICGENWNVPCGFGSYAHAVAWPAMVSCRMVPNTGKPAFFLKSEGFFGTRYHYPALDGRIVFAMPPSGSEETVIGYGAGNVYYVNDKTGDDKNVGTDRDHPFQTLQKAYDEATGNYCYVLVAPGTYDKGGTEVDGVTNRLYCGTSKSIQFVAEGGPDVTFIKGAADRESEIDGLGPAAVRCVRWSSNHNEAAMRGFTFIDGHASGEDVTSHNSWKIGPKHEGGAVYAEGSGPVRFLDCVFSNNVANASAANSRGYFVRCRFYQNRPYHLSGGTGRSGTYVFCEFGDNEEQGQNHTLDNSSQNLYFCSVRGRVSPKQSNIYASLLVGMNNLSDPTITGNVDFDGNLVNGATITRTSGTGTLNYIADDPRLVDFVGTGSRLWAVSPAVGGANVTAFDKAIAVATADLDGRKPYFKGGYPSIGAHQWPMQAVFVAGPKDSVTVTGGNVGTNALEAGESIVVTASPTRKGGNFLGWTIDDVELPYEGLEYGYVAPDDPDLTMTTILARYEKLGFMLLFR